MPSLLSYLCAAALAAAPQADAEGRPRPAGASEDVAGTSRQQEDTPRGEPLVTDRPDATESAETVAPGLFQLETGYTFARVDGTDAHSLGEVLVRIGVADDLELRVGLDSFEWTDGPGADASGFSDTFIGVKWQLAEAGPAGSGRPSVALLGGTSLPTGADEIGSDGAEPELLLAAGLDLSERWSLGANVGWSSIRDGELDERVSALRSSVALGYGIDERWGAYFEYFGSYGLDGREDESFLNGGLTYLISNDLQLDGRVGYGLNGRDDDLFAGFGAAVRW